MCNLKRLRQDVTNIEGFSREVQWRYGTLIVEPEYWYVHRRFGSERKILIIFGHLQ